MNRAAIEQYQSVGLRGQLAEASAHKLIAMQLDGILERLASARGAIERGETQQKGALLSKTIAIVDNLRVSLDMDKGGDLAENLASLYDYIERRLFEANAGSDIGILEEITSIVREIKSGWDAIPEEMRNV